MISFLTFDSFITKYILICFYYFGAIVIPIILWITKNKICNRFEICTSFKNKLYDRFNELSISNRLYLIISAIFIFLIMELAWRMIFETVIAYFQIRDYLHTLQ